MRRFFLPALIVGLILLLGYGATSKERSRKIAYEAPVFALEYANRGVRRIAWEITETRAEKGHACAIFQTGLHRLPAVKGGLTRLFNRPIEWYTGVQTNRDEARRLILEAADRGCRDAQRFEWNTGLRSQGATSKYLDPFGYMDWASVVAHARRGDLEARYLEATTMASSEKTAEKRGIPFDPDLGQRRLQRLASQGHFSANMDVWRARSGLSRELERAYTLFLRGDFSPRDGYLIHERYLAHAVVTCDTSSYGRAMRVFDRIRDVSDHKMHEVLERMNRFDAACGRVS